jgi:hypothetical protein
MGDMHPMFFACFDGTLYLNLAMVLVVERHGYEVFVFLQI